MELPHYKLVAEKTSQVYEFTSEGEKGKIKKLIKFSQTEKEGYFNLAFGDIDLTTGYINDQSRSNNGDSEQVLATVVSAVHLFTQKYKEAWVYATGSTKARTRLYRMGITKYMDEAKKNYYILGKIDDEWKEFQKNVDYTAYLVQRK